MCCEKLCTAFGAPEKCFDHLLSCEENGRKFSIQLPKKSAETFCRVKVYGCVIPKDSSQERCDFMFCRCSNEELYFTELKGTDVQKAFSQIKSTIDFARPKLKFKPEQVSGFIIVSRCPLSSAAIQKMRNEFKKKKYGQVLEVHTREWMHKVELK